MHHRVTCRGSTRKKVPKYKSEVGGVLERSITLRSRFGFIAFLPEVSIDINESVENH